MRPLRGVTGLRVNPQSSFRSFSHDPSPPLADEIFRSAHRSGGYTQGDATYLSLVCAFSDADPPDLPALRRLLSRMRRDARPFPERVFIPILRALGRAGLPLAAFRLFDRLLPTFRCRPSVRSLNSALAALLSSPGHPASLAFPFLSSALRRHPYLSPNLLTFNLLLKALCRSGAVEHALNLLRDRHLDATDGLRFHLPFPLRPDVYSYSTVIDALARTSRLEDALALLDEMQLDGVAPSAVTFNSLLRALCRASNLSRAAKLARYMLLKGCPPTLATYNTLVHGLCLRGRLDAAAALLARMPRDGCKPNEVTYGALVHGLVRLGRSSDAKHLVEHMAANGLRANEFIYSALITGFFRSNQPDEAIRIWDEIATSSSIKPNTVLYTSLIDGLCCHGRMEAAEEALGKMTAEGCAPNVLTFSSIIRGYFLAGNSQRALATWKRMVELGLEPNAVSYSILIHGFCEEGRLKDSMMVWKNMLSKGCDPDLIAYSSMIRGLCEAGMVDRGLRLFNDMLARGDVEPDAITYNILFHSLLKGGNLTRAMDLLGRMLNEGCDPDPVTCNIFLEVMAVEGEGKEFLDGLVVRLVKRGRVEGASGIVEVMLRKYLAPEASIWEKVLRGVCKRRKVWGMIDECWGKMWG